ncbi:MAG: hypothetical protein EP347_01115 [Alphaproteobacteria bacterium]|nr:MAG: hypothetical protein EP347_01115 [Alphaproteobacteria bacterium]
MGCLRAFSAVCLSLFLLSPQGPVFAAATTEKDFDPVAQQQLAQWDRWQMLLEVSERCPTLAPYMRWGLYAQMDYLTDPKSPLGQTLAREAAEVYGPGEAAVETYRADFFADRAAQVKRLFRGRACSDPELQSMALEAQPIARFGLYEKLYVFTRLEEGFCAPSDLAATFAPYLKKDMSRIGETLSETRSLKAQVDGLDRGAVEDHCIGSGASRTSTDPLTGNILYDYMAEVEQRELGYPYELILPLVPLSAEAPSYMAWRDRVKGANSPVAAGMLATAVCLQPMQKFRDDGTLRGMVDDIDFYFGVDRDGALAVQLGADKPLVVTEVVLDSSGGVSIPASGEIAPLAVTEKARARAALEGHLKRYVFDRGEIDPFVTTGAPVAVRFKIQDRGGEAVWAASGCLFNLETLYQAYGWAREPGGLGRLIE